MRLKQTRENQTPLLSMNCSLQAPQSMGFPRSGLPFPSPRDLPDPGIEPVSPTLQPDSLPSEPLKEVHSSKGS